MGKVLVKHNERVEVELYQPVFVSDESHDSKVAQLNGVARDIRRHVDGVGAATVVWDTTAVCSHCGALWTEAGDIHNGGCCAVDCDVMDATTEGAADEPA